MSSPVLTGPAAPSRRDSLRMVEEAVMRITDSIAQLGAKLDEWFDGNIEPFASNDPALQGKAILRGVALVRELDRLKANGLAALTALLDRGGGATEQQRAASLIQGFEFGVRLGGALRDEYLD